MAWLSRHRPPVGVPIAAGESPRIWRTSPALQKDVRRVVDRLHARNNRDNADYSFLNAVGQTDGNGNRGALQGLKFLLSGSVIAHGDAVIVDHFVHNPQNDWALIRLAANVNDAIRPMIIAAVDGTRLPKYRQLSLARFPTDRRATHGDRLDLKDLWESDGEVVRLVWSSTDAAVVESTIQASRGNSGGPLYGDFDGRRHLVIGIHQGIRGNGIDVSEDRPNIRVFFTPGTLASIRAAQAGSPCPAS